MSQPPKPLKYPRKLILSGPESSDSLERLLRAGFSVHVRCQAPDMFTPSRQDCDDCCTLGDEKGARPYRGLRAPTTENPDRRRPLPPDVERQSPPVDLPRR